MISKSVLYRAILVSTLCFGVALVACKDKGKKSGGEGAQPAAKEPAEKAPTETPAKGSPADNPAADEQKDPFAWEKVEPVQAEGLPTGAEILDRFAEATGGKAHDAIENRLVKGTLSMPKVKIEGPLTLYQARPNKLYIVMEIAGVGKVEQGFNGEVAWTTMQMTGPRILEGDERAAMVEQATVDAERKWRSFYKEAVTVGVEDVDGKPAYMVVRTRNSGTRQAAWFDKASGLMVKTAGKVKSAMGDVATVSRLSDYRTVDGVTMPFKTELTAMGQEQVVTMSSVEQNIKMVADQFALPKDVAALVKGSKPATAPKKAPAKKKAAAK